MIKTPLPAGFIEYLGQLDGLDDAELVKALDSPPATAIRLNSAKSGAIPGPLYPGATEVEWCPSGYRLPERPVFTLNPLLHAGVFYVQDPSSMIYRGIVESLLPMIGKDRVTVLDFCAAPGGKTTAMIDALPRGSVVVANEFVAARGRILRENLEKWGYPGVITTGASSEEYSGLPPMFDIVAVDAPCSGEGMMRKDEEARRQWSLKLTEQCASLQRSILADVAPTVRPGGFLVYSTCTFNTLEDEDNSRYLRDVLGFEPVPIDALSLKGTGKAGRALYPDVEALRFMPHLTDGEGLYVSVFRRAGESSGAGYASGPSRRDRKNRRATRDMTPFPAQEEEIKSWFTPEWRMIPLPGDTLVTALPEEAAPILETLARAGVRVTGAGLPAAETKGKVVIPDSRIVLSEAYRRGAFPEAGLTLEDALRYLRRETVTLPPGCPKGYVCVSYEGQPLGLVKNIGQRANNLYPSSWKIHL